MGINKARIGFIPQAHPELCEVSPVTVGFGKEHQWVHTDVILLDSPAGALAPFST